MSKLLYCVWTKVDSDAEKDWVKYMDSKHIPEVLATNCFISARRLKVVEGNAPGNYLVIYESKNKEQLNEYFETKADQLRKDHVDHFGSKVSSSRVILEDGFFMQK